MAEIYAIKSGNWSDPTIWNTGILPTDGDDVYANGFVVSLDVDVDVAQITNAAGAVAAAGGRFVTANALNSISCNVVAGSARCLDVLHNVVEIEVDATGGSGGSSYGIYITNNATIGTFSGDATGGSEGRSYGIYITNNATIGTFSGDVTGGSGGSSYGIYITNNATIGTFSGNVTGGYGSSSFGIYITSDTTIGTFYGNVTGGYGASSFGIYNTGGFITNITESSTFTGVVSNPALVTSSPVLINGTVELRDNTVFPVSGTGVFFGGKAKVVSYLPNDIFGFLTGPVYTFENLPDGARIVPPDQPAYCRLYAFVKMPSGDIPTVHEAMSRAYLKVEQDPTGTIGFFDKPVYPGYFSDNGMLYWDVPRGATVTISVLNFFTKKTIVVPNQPTFDILG